MGEAAWRGRDPTRPGPMRPGSLRPGSMRPGSLRPGSLRPGPTCRSPRAGSTPDRAARRQPRSIVRSIRRSGISRARPAPHTPRRPANGSRTRAQYRPCKSRRRFSPSRPGRARPRDFGPRHSVLHRCTPANVSIAGINIEAIDRGGKPAMSFSPIQPVANGISDSQNSRCMLAQRIAPFTRGRMQQMVVVVPVDRHEHKAQD